MKVMGKAIFVGMRTIGKMGNQVHVYLPSRLRSYVGKKALIIVIINEDE